MRAITIVAVLWLLCSGLFPRVCLAEPQNIRPNILLIVVDDLGYGELGCQGNPEIPTPNIDSIATHGVRFTNGYMSAPVCSPSRAGFFTGRYQTRFGYEFNSIGPHNREAHVGLPLAEKTLAGRLKDAGYTTALVGKWHLGASKSHHPLDRGFDHFYGFLHEGHFYVPPPYPGVLSWFRVSSLPDGSGMRLQRKNYIFSAHLGSTEPPYDEENSILRGREPVREDEYLTSALAREAVAFIDRHAGGPFFLYVSFNVPHSPMQAQLEEIKQFTSIPDLQRLIFAGMIASLDLSVGRILQALSRRQIEENTLIVFFSDNGGPTRELTSSNRPLRGGKGDLYEGGLRVPFLLQWKGRIPGGRTYDYPVISLDLVPTALAAAGASEQLPELDGVNLLPYLSDEAGGVPHDTLFWRYGSRIALRKGNWKLVRNPPRNRNAAEFELYDLSSDLSEKDDVRSLHPDIVSDLYRETEHYNNQMVEPLWRPQGARPRENWPLDLIEP